MTDDTNVRGNDETERDAEADGGGHPPQYRPPAQEEFDWRGWMLVAVVVVSFLIVPTAILYLPAAQGLVTSLGLTLRQAYLGLPLVPAVVLAATAVWAALRARSNDR